MGTTLKYIYLFVFCGLLLIVPLFSILGIRTSGDADFVSLEKRPRTDFPKWVASKRSMKAYFPQMELYLDDRFAFRQDLLLLNANLNFRMGRAMNPDKVVVGTNGWLFVGNGYFETINQYRGLKPLSEKQLSRWLRYFNTLQDYLKSRNIRFCLALTPEKHSIYPEYLPPYIIKKGVSPYDQIVSRKGNLNLVDLRKTLLESKKEHQKLLFYKTGTHWNQFGAYLAYRRIMNSLDTVSGPDPVILTDSQFSCRQSSNKKDLQKLIMGELLFSDFEINSKVALAPQMLRYKELRRKNEWADLSPNAGVDIFYSPIVVNTQKKGRLLVFGDSFSIYLSIYLNNTYREVAYVHYNSVESGDISKLLDQYQPDAVLFQLLERHLIQPITSMIPLSDSLMAVPLIKISNRQIFSGSEFRNTISRIHLENNSLCFRSADSDPYFLLPDLALPGDGLILKIDLTAPKSTSIQVYYQTEQDKEYSESQSVKKNITAGRQTVFLRLSGEGIRGKLRIDPGMVAGDYQIHEITVCE